MAASHYKPRYFNCKLALVSQLSSQKCKHYSVFHVVEPVILIPTHLCSRNETLKTLNMHKTLPTPLCYLQKAVMICVWWQDLPLYHIQHSSCPCIIPFHHFSPQKTSFHPPLLPSFSAAGKKQLPSCWDQRESGFEQRKMTGTVSRDTTPHLRWRTASRSFCTSDVSCSVSRRNTRKLRRGTLRWGATV